MFRKDKRLKKKEVRINKKKIQTRVILKLQRALLHLQGTLLGAAEAANYELTLLKHEVGGRGVVEVQVSQDVAVMMHHAGPEGGADVRAALLALSRAGAPAAQRQVSSHLAPARSITCGQILIVMDFSTQNCPAHLLH